MVTSVKEITAENLLTMRDDGFRYELVRGELKKMSPGFKRGSMAHNIALSLGQQVAAKGLGVVTAAETGFKIRTNPDTVRAPNVAFVSRERLEALGDIEGFFPGAPDVAIEVIPLDSRCARTSPHDSYSDVEEKVFEWLETGSQMVLVVNPRKRTVTVYRSRADIKVLTEDETLEGGEVVPGWRLALNDLFA